MDGLPIVPPALAESYLFSILIIWIQNEESREIAKKTEHGGNDVVVNFFYESPTINILYIMVPEIKSLTTKGYFEDHFIHEVYF